MRANVCFRLARSAAFSTVCVFLAVGAHWFAGGGGPALQALLVGGLAVMAGATALAGRERSPGVIVGLLLAAQAFLHQLLESTAPSGTTARLGMPAPPHEAGGAAHPVHGVYEHGDPLSVSAGMLIAHIVAALVTGWWLSRGEAVVWSILRRIGASAIRWLGPSLTMLGTAAVGVAGPCAPEPDGAKPRSVGVLRHSVVRRGPPAVLFS